LRRDHIREGKGSVPKEAHEEGLRVARALHDRIQARGLSVRRVEERVGWGQGTLNLALTGSTPLRISHIAAVCKAIGFPLAEFYRDLAKEIEAPAPQRRQKDVAPGLSEDELLEAVRDLIRRHRLPLPDEE
jgi:transcriptional regulator with XRE-family HTH domain